MVTTPEPFESVIAGPQGSGVAPSDGPPLLSLRGISKSFGAVQAMRHVDLDVPAGQVTAIIGDNGAGKSTLIKTISGIWAQSSGHILWKGQHGQISSSARGLTLGWSAPGSCGRPRGHA